MNELTQHQKNNTVSNFLKASRIERTDTEKLFDMADQMARPAGNEAGIIREDHQKSKPLSEKFSKEAYMALRAITILPAAIDTARTEKQMFTEDYIAVGQYIKGKTAKELADDLSQSLRSSLATIEQKEQLANVIGKLQKMGDAKPLPSFDYYN